MQQSPQSQVLIDFHGAEVPSRIRVDVITKTVNGDESTVTYSIPQNGRTVAEELLGGLEKYDIAVRGVKFEIVNAWYGYRAARAHGGGKWMELTDVNSKELHYAVAVRP
jgi:hypothetical protein